MDGGKFVPIHFGDYFLGESKRFKLPTPQVETTPTVPEGMILTLEFSP